MKSVNSTLAALFNLNKAAVVDHGLWPHKLHPLQAIIDFTPVQATSCQNLRLSPTPHPNSLRTQLHRSSMSCRARTRILPSTPAACAHLHRSTMKCPLDLPLAMASSLARRYASSICIARAQGAEELEPLLELICRELRAAPVCLCSMPVKWAGSGCAKDEYQVGTRTPCRALGYSSYTRATH